MRCVHALLGAALLMWMSACSGGSTYRDPGGFTIDLPVGWTAHKDADGQIDVSGREGHIRILPVFTRQSLTGRLAGLSLVQAAEKRWRDVQWTGQAQPVGASAVRMEGLTAQGKAMASFVWTSSPAGTAGYFYRIDASHSAGETERATLLRILSSFRLTGGPAKAAGQPAAPSYIKWTDPREKAFTIEPPSGWKVEGGLYRLAALDPRMVWRLESPGGDIHIMSGDPQVPVFTVPNQMMVATGFREGSWYSPGYGQRMLVRRFADGASFAREYVTQQVGQTCQNIAVSGSRQRPDLEEALTRIERAYNLASRLTMGEATFTCTLNGRLMTGYLLAGTRYTGMGENGIWNAEHLIGFLATQDQAASARQVMEHIIATSQVNPQWLAGQQNLTASVSKIVTQTNNEISHMINEGYAERHRNDVEMDRRRSNAILGVVDAVDPDTGRSYRIDSGSDYYWVDNQGHIAGTRTGTTPSVDFRQLVVLP